MADYWKSNPKKYCDLCKCWLQDNKISINNHESGQRHITNVQKKLNDLRKGVKESSKDKSEKSISRINDLAFVGMMKDIERDPSLATRYGVSLSDDQYGNMKERLKEIEKKKEDNKKTKKGKEKKKDKPIAPPVLQPTTKPIVYEWKEVKTADGRMYYWNKKNGETQWERPQATIQPANDSECVSKEKERLDQFLFSRLVELSESGSTEASAAVCQKFDATAERSPSPPPPQPSPPTDLVFEQTRAYEEPVFMEPINLLGEWQPVVPEEVQEVELPEVKPNPPPAKRARPESQIKMKINTLANKVHKGDEERLQAVAEKAELLSHLSEVNEDNIFSAQHLEFKEKHASVSLAAQKAIKTLESCLKSDPEGPPTHPAFATSAITFKRKANAHRSLRGRTRDN